MALHSIYEFRWKNFKGFKDTGWIRIKPITILIGPNNVGKTNFITPILLMSQTLSSRDVTTPLITKGRLINCGSYSDIIHNNDLSKELFFGIRYLSHDPIDNIKKLWAYPPGANEVTLKYDKANEKVILKSQTIYDIYKRKFFDIYKTDNGMTLVDGIDNRKLRKVEKKAISASSALNFVYSPTPIVKNLEIGSDDDSTFSEMQYSEEFSKLISAIAFNTSELRDLLNSLSFIGPLREIPHKYYEIESETYKTVGPSGENMANLVRYNFEQYKVKINFWIKKFGFGDELVIEKLSEDLFSILFFEKRGNKKTRISNSGFGASQVLPLIVQAIIAEEQSLTIAEQPEIHLNPKLQCELADLFIEMANNGKRIIVETHSEHLLLRLRRLIAEKKIDSDKVGIFFIDKKENESIIKEISLQNNGYIDPNDWPKDFFGEALKEALSLAKEQAKQVRND